LRRRGGPRRDVVGGQAVRALRHAGCARPEVAARPLMTFRVGIALGSNLGNRLGNLREARRLLRDLAAPGEPFLQAPVYQTEPVGCPEGSPDFYNTAVEIGFGGQAHDLLDRTRAIEFHLGRTVAAERNAPRSIDVD